MATKPPTRIHIHQPEYLFGDISTYIHHYSRWASKHDQIDWGADTINIGPQKNALGFNVSKAIGLHTKN